MQRKSVKTVKKKNGAGKGSVVAVRGTRRCKGRNLCLKIDPSIISAVELPGKKCSLR